VRRRGHGDDAGVAAVAGPEDLVEEQVGEQEVAKVVHANLLLEAVRRRLPIGQRHHPRVVYQDVQLAVSRLEGLCEVANARERG
jgi:hypothetical protein